MVPVNQAAIVVTRHATQRGKARLGLSRHAVERLARRAFVEGHHQGEFTGQFARWLEEFLDLNPEKGHHLRIYGEHVWLFADLQLVTVFRVAAHLRCRLRRKEWS